MRALRLALALLSFTTLVYELALMRLFSVTLWYYFAFFVISLALLGGSAASVALFVRRHALEHSLEARLPTWATAFGLACAASPAVYLQSNLVIFGTDDPRGRLIVILLLFLVPFALGGLTSAALLSRFANEFETLYWADLGGASLGCLAIVPLLWRVPVPELLAWIGWLPALAGLLLARSLGVRWLSRGRVAWLLALAGLCGLSLTPATPYRVRFSKQNMLDTSLDYVRWTPLARLSVYRSIYFVNDGQRSFGWGMGSTFPGGTTDQLWIEQDESAGTPMTGFHGNLSALDFLRWDVTNFAHQYRRFDRVLIVGAGGGRDILSAKRFGATDVTAVELNPAMVEITNERYGDFTSHPYSLPGVHARIAEARSELSRSHERWNLIQISLIDTWAASMAGAFALSENNLYTLEAFQTYLDRLSPDGVLSVSRWYAEGHEAELGRLVNLAAAALDQRGIHDSSEHIVVAQGDYVGTVLVSPHGFDRAERERMMASARELGHRVIWIAGAPPGSTLISRLVSAQRTETLRQLPIDLSAPTDDRPFFFLFLPNTSGPAARTTESGAMIIDAQSKRAAVSLIDLLLVALLVASVCFVAIPALLELRAQRGLGSLLWRTPQVWLYFAALGAGFMLVELSLIQRYVLFLGHPTYASSVVIFSLLLSAGAGSYSTRRIPAQRSRREALVGIAIIVALLGVQALAVPRLLSTRMGDPLALRVVLCVVLLAPLGGAMGRALPLGIARLRGGAMQELVPYVWAMNGLFSVVSSACATLIAVTHGYTAALGAGMAIYAAALLFMILRWGEAALAPA